MCTTYVVTHPHPDRAVAAARPMAESVSSAGYSLLLEGKVREMNLVLFSSMFSSNMKKQKCRVANIILSGLESVSIVVTV